MSIQSLWIDENIYSIFVMLVSFEFVVQNVMLNVFFFRARGACFQIFVSSVF